LYGKIPKAGGGSKMPSESEIHLFADSRYHLYVNGTHINFGPSRFYLAHPEYDTYEMKGYLKEGENVIAVEVLANGMETFQLPKSIGGFIAWGSVIESTVNEINLETPGNWKMLSVASMDTNTIKFSFACGALENQDLNKEPSGWQNISFNDQGWQNPVEIKNQSHWGELTPRKIPHMTQNEKTPLLCLGIFKEQKEEVISSFYVKTPDETATDYNSGQNMLGYTYIFSPKDQEIELGTWWGDYYLNGEGPLQVSSKNNSNPVRENRVFKLKKGWNYLFVYYRAIWGAWEFTVAVPANSGLQFAADKKKKGTIFFKTLTPLSKEQSVELVNKFKTNEKELLKSLGSLNWLSQSYSKRIENPARELVWHHPDFFNNLKENDYQTRDFVTTGSRYYVFDMGHKTLGRLFIDIDAPKGTVIELGWSEDLNKYQTPYLYKRMQINSGARFITNGTQNRYATFKPYGVRYIIVKVVPAQNQKVKIHQLGVIEQVYPYEKAGWFECSDPEDSYIDTPFRERGLYAGDALPEYAITLATSGESRLMKKSLVLFQDMYREEMITGSENRHNDFILKTLIELYWYYKYTGDSIFAKLLYPNYK